MVSVHAQSAHVCSGRLHRSQQIVSRSVRTHGLLHRPTFTRSHRGQTRGGCALAAASTSPATLPSELKKIVDLFNMVRGHAIALMYNIYSLEAEHASKTVSWQAGARSQTKVSATAVIRQEAACHAIRVPHRGEQSTRLRVTGKRLSLHLARGKLCLEQCPDRNLPVCSGVGQARGARRQDLLAGGLRLRPDQGMHALPATAAPSFGMPPVPLIIAAPQAQPDTIALSLAISRAYLALHHCRLA